MGRAVINFKFMRLRQGAYVRGKTCFGVPFTGVVLRMHSPYMVHLTPDHLTPVGLLTHVNGEEIPTDRVRFLCSNSDLKPARSKQK